jgi:hypothetical protein
MVMRRCFKLTELNSTEVSSLLRLGKIISSSFIHLPNNDLIIIETAKPPQSIESEQEDTPGHA